MNSTKTAVTHTATPEAAATSIRNWNHALRAGHSRMKTIFDLYEGFTIEASTLPPGDDDFHVYIGLDSQNDDAKLEFFMVHASNDNPQNIGNPGVITRYDARRIKPAPGDYQPIPDDEGIRRILNWTLNRNNWIADLFTQERAMFQCWSVPLSDVDRSMDVYKITFGLVVSTESAEPDLIIQHVNNIPNFYDLVRPVPPFKSGEMTEFHLLMEALR